MLVTLKTESLKSKQVVETKLYCIVRTFFRSFFCLLVKMSSSHVAAVKYGSRRLCSAISGTFSKAGLEYQVTKIPRPGLNFINVPWAAYTIADPEKRQSSWQCPLVLLAPSSVKAARKTLGKLTPVVNIIKLLGTYLKAKLHLLERGRRLLAFRRLEIL